MYEEGRMWLKFLFDNRLGLGRADFNSARPQTHLLHGWENDLNWVRSTSLKITQATSSTPWAEWKKQRKAHVLRPWSTLVSVKENRLFGRLPRAGKKWPETLRVGPDPSPPQGSASPSNARGICFGRMAKRYWSRNANKNIQLLIMQTDEVQKSGPIVILRMHGELTIGLLLPTTQWQLTQWLTSCTQAWIILGNENASHTEDYQSTVKHHGRLHNVGKSFSLLMNDLALAVALTRPRASRLKVESCTTDWRWIRFLEKSSNHNPMRKKEVRLCIVPTPP